MQVGVLPDLEQCRAPDGADRLPGLDLVPGGDSGRGGQILIVGDATVVVPDDDRRAEQLVVIDGLVWCSLFAQQITLKFLLDFS